MYITTVDGLAAPFDEGVGAYMQAHGTDAGVCLKVWVPHNYRFALGFSSTPTQSISVQKATRVTPAMCCMNLLSEQSGMAYCFGVGLIEFPSFRRISLAVS